MRGGDGGDEGLVKLQRLPAQNQRNASQQLRSLEYHVLPLHTPPHTTATHLHDAPLDVPPAEELQVGGLQRLESPEGDPPSGSHPRRRKAESPQGLPEGPRLGGGVVVSQAWEERSGKCEALGGGTGQGGYKSAPSERRQMTALLVILSAPYAHACTRLQTFLYLF